MALFFVFTRLYQTIQNVLSLFNFNLVLFAGTIEHFIFVIRLTRNVQPGCMSYCRKANANIAIFIFLFLQGFSNALGILLYKAHDRGSTPKKKKTRWR